MEIDAARSFVRENPRAVLVTTRKSGGPQMSPVLAVVGEDGRLMISSRQAAFKTKNIRHDPRVSLCFLNDGFFGDWIQVDGTAEIVGMPEAMDLLVDYYRRAQGEHEDWDEYRATMARDKRLIIFVTIERAGPDKAG